MPWCCYEWNNKNNNKMHPWMTFTAAICLLSFSKERHYLKCISSFYTICFVNFCFFFPKHIIIFVLSKYIFWQFISVIYPTIFFFSFSFNFSSLFLFLQYFVWVTMIYRPVKIIQRNTWMRKNQAKGKKQKRKKKCRHRLLCF